eukprot:357754-Chlamydomonas_euryale.AAC.2
MGCAYPTPPNAHEATRTAASSRRYIAHQVCTSTHKHKPGLFLIAVCRWTRQAVHTPHQRRMYQPAALRSVSSCKSVHTSLTRQQPPPLPLDGTRSRVHGKGHASAGASRIAGSPERQTVAGL